MVNKKPFEITKLPETYVAGLALRTSNRTEQKLKDKGWIVSACEKERQMDGCPSTHLEAHPILFN